MRAKEWPPGHNIIKRLIPVVKAWMVPITADTQHKMNTLSPPNAAPTMSPAKASNK